MEPKIEIFLSYSHKDEKYCQELMRHLVSLQRQQSVSFWYDRQIAPGTNWAQEIEKHVYTSRIILLLMSADYLASDLLSSKEINLALERQKEGEAHVVPIILRPCLWKNTTIRDLPVLPTNRKPVTEWLNINLAFVDITRAIRRIIEKMREEQSIPKQRDVTIYAPVSVDEKRLADLEEKLHERYLFIQNWGAFLRVTGTPEEKAQAQTAIARQWRAIAADLSEYQILVRKLGRSVPTEILQLSKQFEEY
ncbi:MAG TPA: toll/interleukin-1 receptor domain-containing protein [Ktedonobacteraceae bacterium]|nr:toll/interleukin-1 receptor domain-containing protein [Ktedonobacteraceae bacterium]